MIRLKNVKKIHNSSDFYFSLSSCETNGENNKIIGQIIGLGLGALVGYQFGSGVGGALAISLEEQY